MKRRTAGQGTQNLHTFHGRDVYSYTGARLAAGVIDFAGVGPKLPPQPVKFRYEHPKLSDGVVVGHLVHVEKPFGNLVTNIPAALLEQAGLKPDERQVLVTIRNGQQTVLQEPLPFVPSFGFVAEGDPLLYVDSLNTVGLAVTNGNFARQYSVAAGDGWSVIIAPANTD